MRYGYPEPFHTALMPEAFQMWSEVEEKAGKRLIRFGLVYVCSMCDIIIWVAICYNFVAEVCSL